MIIGPKGTGSHAAPGPTREPGPPDPHARLPRAAPTPPPSNKWFYALVDGATDSLGFIGAGFVDNQITTPACTAPASGPANPPQPAQPSPNNPPAAASSGGSPGSASSPAGNQSGSSPQGNPASNPAPQTFTETVGGPTHTWTDYSDAGDTEGPTIPTGQSVQVACVVQGFEVTDGNTNWYLIASSPWNNAYYASADAFYNNGATSGSLAGTPNVDPVVPAC